MTSASTRRPSASVLMTSTVSPAAVFTTSPGRCASPDGMFSTSPTSPTASTLALRAGQRRHQPDDGAGAGHVPLHVLHPRGGLDGDAAGVEGHALADEGDRLAGGLLGLGRRRRSTASPPRGVPGWSPGRRRAARPCRASSSPSGRAPRPPRRASRAPCSAPPSPRGGGCSAARETRSRDRNTPSATARIGAQAALAAAATSVAKATRSSFGLSSSFSVVR